MNAAARITALFGSLADVIAAHATERPGHRALATTQGTLTYGELDRLAGCIATALQRDGAIPRSAIAIVAPASLEYVALFIGALRVGVAVAPLPPSATPSQLAAMIRDAAVTHVFLDAENERALGPVLAGTPVRRVRCEAEALRTWLDGVPNRPARTLIEPDMPFNIIYSSGTTGTPKGIVQPHRMRWAHAQRGTTYGYGPASVTLLATPLYSNTTLVSLVPTLAMGGTAVLMEKFDATAYLRLAERHRATHTMLVPVQYQRIMAHADFARFDLTSLAAKFCTSAPFAAALKADILARWPGKLFEFYGMTEGGGTFILAAHDHPDKLHTVGRAAPGHDIRLIDEAGREVGPGEVGEVVGHSQTMMTGYHNQPALTAAAEWFDASGKRFIRTGDLARLDAAGFLTLLDRRKDMIISGGFNVFPSDLETILHAHPAVREAAVVGVPSERWGETPVAFVALAAQTTLTADALREWVNHQVSKVQRLHALRLVDALPRSAIGKVLKRELRDRFGQASDAREPDG